MGAVYRSGLPFLLQRLSASLLSHFPLCSSVLLLVGDSWSQGSAIASLRNFSLTHKDVVSGSSLFQAAVFLSTPMAFPDM